MPIPVPPRNTNHATERGGITILVALMLLVFLTITAIGMSRNSFREVVISGTARQGAMTRNAADSGIEFGILWIQPASMQGGATNGSSAAQFQALAANLKTNELYGIAHKLDGSLYTAANTATPPADLQVPANSGNGFNLALTAMGKMPMTDQSQTAGSSSSGYTPASGSISLVAPDLFGVRSDGVVNAGGAVFLHSKEAWISKPAN